MGWPSKRQLRRYWRPFRVVVGFALVGVAAWVITGKTSELAGASAFLTQLRWFWLALGGLAELCSFVALATVQRLLLRSGGVRMRLTRVTSVTFAGSSIQAALPIGAAFAGLYVFRQYEVAGADDVLAGWVVIATFTVAFATLATLAGVGLAFAASTGSTFDLVGAILAVLVLAILVVIAWVKRAKAYDFLARAAGSLEQRMHRPAGQFTGPLAETLERMSTVAPARKDWLKAVVAGGADWVADCGCLAFAFLAVGSPVPWQGLLLAYCAAQLAVNLPITPGGLGVVEGSLTVALVAFGGGRAPTVAAVLLYRLLSFWIPLPIGAACYLVLARGRRLRERTMQAAAAAAGPPQSAELSAAPDKPTVSPDGVPIPTRAGSGDTGTSDASASDASNSDASNSDDIPADSPGTRPADATATRSGGTTTNPESAGDRASSDAASSASTSGDRASSDSATGGSASRKSASPGSASSGSTSGGNAGATSRNRGPRAVTEDE
jgi:putative heme transporter